MQLGPGSEGPLAAANFHLSANECLSAVFIQNAMKLKQLTDHQHPTVFVGCSLHPVITRYNSNG